MDLLWRNNITPDKVVLGTAFYGRAFTASSSSCLVPGCTFESGANKGPCSREVSILLGSEISDIIARTGNTPVLDKDAAVKILTFDNDQWVAYDDADTLKMKADFARSQCLGGVMVWAVSHDTPNGDFTKGLAAAANRKVVSIAMKDTSGDDNSTTTVTPHAQCKWTNCMDSKCCMFSKSTQC
jgi:chitinase